jgi:hypothetical protein
MKQVIIYMGDLRIYSNGRLYQKADFYREIYANPIYVIKHII